MLHCLEQFYMYEHTLPLPVNLYINMGEEPAFSFQDPIYSTTLHLVVLFPQTSLTNGGFSDLFLMTLTVWRILFRYFRMFSHWYWSGLAPVIRRDVGFEDEGAACHFCHTISTWLLTSTIDLDDLVRLCCEVSSAEVHFFSKYSTPSEYIAHRPHCATYGPLVV